MGDDKTMDGGEAEPATARNPPAHPGRPAPRPAPPGWGTAGSPPPREARRGSYLLLLSIAGLQWPAGN